ncbi:peptidylprolyl isomerase [bacterium]|nr:peptidylprolyl isomerase [bacterium]
MKPRVLAIHYTLTNTKGETLDSSAGQEPLYYMEGSGQIIPGLESRISALKVGDKQKVNVPAAEGYGIRDDKLKMTVEKSQLPTKKINVGDQFMVGASQESSMPVTVTEVTETHVTLDGNHPLADQDLTFDIEIVEIRDATDEEMMHGHAHGPHGHHHH